MKKLFILTTLLLTLGLTGCGNKAEANEVTEVETNIQVEEISTEKLGDTWRYIKEYNMLEEIKMETIADLEAEWEERGIPNEECRDELIELLRSIEYDDSYLYTYDLDSFERACVNILVKYNALPEECAGCNFDELEGADEFMNVFLR